MAKRKTVVDFVTMLAEAFSRKCTEATFDAYYRVLKDAPEGQVVAAFNAALRSSREFMPNPGQILELALTGGRGVESQCDAAWLVFSEAVRRHGSDTSVNFRDALINATVRIRGGWQRCCSLDAEEFEKWFRKEFNSTYALLLTGGCGEHLAGYLVGNNERNNAQWVGSEYGKGGKPYELPAPVDIDGDYTPALVSIPGHAQLTSRPANVPKIEFKKVNQA